MANDKDKKEKKPKRPKKDEVVSETTTTRTDSKTPLAGLELESVTIEHFFDTVLEQKITVVDFYAEWCEPCQKLMAILPPLAKKLEGKARFIKVNTDIEKELVDIYNIKKLPTFVFLVDGAEVDRLPKVPTLKQIEAKVNELYGDHGGIY